MKIISWNVNGIRAVAKKGLNEIIEQLDADMICFQETKAQDDQVKEVLASFEDHHLYVNSAEKKGYSGTAILSKKPALSVTYGLGIEEHDNEGRLITAEYEDFFLLTAYVPNSQAGLKRLEYRMRWDKDLLNHMQEL